MLLSAPLSFLSLDCNLTRPTERFIRVLKLIKKAEKLNKKRKIRGKMAGNDWRGSLPLIVLLFAVAALSFGNVNVASGFIGSFVVGTAWLLLIPVLGGVGVGRDVNAWFVRAGAFAYIAAAFVLLNGTFIDSGNWSTWLVQVGWVLSWLMAGIGALIALGTTK